MAWIRFRAGTGLDGVDEADEFLVPMTLHAATDHLAIQDVESGKQRCRAMALVVVRHSATTSLLHRQPRLRAIECLDLARFAD